MPMTPYAAVVCYLNNPGTAELYGIAPGATQLVFFSRSFVEDHGWDVERAIQEQELVAKSSLGTTVPWSFAGRCWHDLCEVVANFKAPTGIPPELGAAALVHWNVEVGNLLVPVIRGEMLVASLSALGLSAAGTLVKLQPALAALQVGMLEEAAGLLGTITPDAFLTADRIARYQAMALSANALPI